MPGCVLRVGVEPFDADTFVRNTGWVLDRVFENGFNLIVSESDELAQQIQDVSDFLNRSKTGLEILKELEASSTLDFGGFWVPDKSARYFNFPAPLLSQLSEMALDLEVSVYASDA